MEQENLTLKHNELNKKIKEELENYSDLEQAAILKQFLLRLKKKRRMINRMEDIKQAFSPPYIWLLIGGGIVLPIMLFITFIWSSLYLEG
ncbi:hypothetical protein [Paenibacillus sp. GCM10028914]|uniref:hypothetical protein n=1 Tax=Paenibacillus sp. GCM10028914 TaxID=3273416 RepID=UPI00361BF4B8